MSKSKRYHVSNHLEGNTYKDLVRATSNQRDLKVKDDSNIDM